MNEHRGESKDDVKPSEILAKMLWEVVSKSQTVTTLLSVTLAEANGGHELVMEQFGICYCNLSRIRNHKTINTL